MAQTILSLLLTLQVRMPLMALPRLKTLLMALRLLKMQLMPPIRQSHLLKTQQMELQYKIMEARQILLPRM